MKKDASLKEINRRCAKPWCNRLLPWAATILMSVLCVHTAVRADIFDDFTDGNDTFNPTWTHSDVGLGGTQIYDASGQNYHLSATVGGFGFSYVGSFVESASDFSITFDLLDWGGGAQKFGAYARATGIDAFLGISGYHFSYQPDNGQVLIRQMINANQGGNNLVSTTYLLDDLKQYQFVFNGSGNHLIGRIYEIGGPADPVVELSADDTTFTSGLSGLLGFGVGVPTDFTIDNFAHVVPEPSAFALMLLGALAGWPLLRRRPGSK
ncbi:MAG: PEP-CTERM sorting domain-containing protein [Verrucomicrobia bacterium]|jgi:hypothetical protein|nr:PEP-CTERM sorting domain-containing protein [Verrucomicrobiota bacterium]NMD21879.1 PEP-CTERM sorting domain-containing protein [Verrucomicrobiota bacterium]OQC62999.1 MAG: hypothetical protein BWX48_03409 [Verrucomicrobia bacterium ADurb.Bin006]